MPGRQSKEILDRLPAGTEDGLRGTGGNAPRRSNTSSGNKPVR